MAAPVVLEWSLPIQCSREEAWAVFSNTDRFNRNFGLVISFREEIDEQGKPRRFGKMRRLGMTLEWEEQPFEYRAPVFFRQERRYSNSPVESLKAECEIQSDGDGVIVNYKLTLVPRNFILRAVVAAEARMATRPTFERVFAAIVDLLEGRDNRYDLPPPSVTHPTLDALDERGGIERAIATHVRDAPLPSQARLRPLEFAHRLGTNDDETIRSFLQAVDVGALELWWELLCPSCQAPKEVRPTFDVADADVHCGSCQIRYDASFPDSVDVVFRPRPDVREVDVPVACLLSPGRTPHVRMQRHAPAGETTTISLDLSAGGHRIDTDPRVGSASLEVRHGLPERITIDLTDRGIVPAILRVGPGEVTIVARNRTSRSIRLQVERAYRPPFALTAGRLFEVDGAREVLPPEAVSPNVHVTVRNAFIAAFREVALNDGDTGAWGWDDDDDAEGLTGNGTTLRVFGTEAALTAFLRTFSSRPGFAVGAAQGPVATMRSGSIDIPTGSTVERAIHLMHTAGGDRVAIDGELARAMDAPDGVRLMWIQEDDFALLCMPFDPSDEERDTTLPDTIGDYVVERELGRGAMGRVLAARSPDGTAVVIKVLLAAFSTDAEHSQRFFNEAHVTAGIRHDHIVNVLDWGRDISGLYMVMERLEGEDLEARLRRGPLHQSEVVGLALQLLDGLQCAHEFGIVHRDIKPANLLVQDDGVLKILDFGIAHPPNIDDDLVNRGVILGTPRYMSPEQVARDPIDARSDIYSAALVLYECLTGDIPFTGNSAQAIALARLGAEPPALEVEGLSNSVSDAILRALSLDPARRFGSASEFASALRS